MLNAADSGSAATAKTSTTTSSSSAAAVNLGKQATKATGELAGVEGYTKYAAEVTGVGPNDWSQWGGSSIRNNTPDAKNIPAEWDLGKLDPNTGAWLNQGAKNIKWATQLGFKSYGNPVVANGHIYVGTNNGAGYLKRYPADVDLGVLLCFDEKTGKMLWQDSNEKLPTGRVNDWPDEGLCCAPFVEGNRLWYVSNRGEVRCLSTSGLAGGKNEGQIKNEKEIALKKNPNAVWEEDKEADVIWVLDMMKQLGSQQHNMCSCSITGAGDVIFVNTGNGVDEAHINLPAPYAPTLVALDKNTGKVLWTDNNPGPNVLHGQWSSPTYAVLGGQPQVILGAGDGWLYSFDPRGEGSKSKLLWKFDCNPKKSKYTLDRADRNHIIGTPVVYEGKVYVGVGEDPEHGEGRGHLWCIDPTKRGDVSPELVFNSADPTKPIAAQAQPGLRGSRRRFHACQSEFRNGLALRRGRRERRRQARYRRNHAPHLRHGGHQRRRALGGRFLRNHSLPRRQNRQVPLDARYAGRQLGLALDYRRQSLHRQRRWQRAGVQIRQGKEIAQHDRHGLQRLQHPDRCQRRAIYLDAKPVVRDCKRLEVRR